ncbi:hypothetical protein [Sphingomonas sp. LaA6.9]|uniref:hypothetical protein n=1 Tax=Sphingomonas sp. LaA6.9 TaxID=2919914 RepID=UPI001F502817|nr:hypothetical protein [Sphingomonas sp. LaA6.9]MCJ8156186.1 hypothetical protein [Sphingomonas sp. LaA6.9]
MSRSTQRVAEARQEAEEAHEQFISTVSAVRSRLTPASLANEARTIVRDKATKAARDGAELVRHRPIAAVAIVVAGIGYLFRDRLLGKMKSLARRKATDPAPQEFQPGKRRPRARRNGG